MKQTVSSELPLTFLEQRLNYARAHPESDWLSFVENVPQWPGAMPAFKPPPGELAGRYENCQGDPELRRAVLARERAVNGITADENQVLITNGALHGLSLVIRAHAAPGAVAMCQSPPYTCVDGLLRGAGFNIRYFSAPYSADGTLPKELRALPAETKIIYINSPHNPTGAVLSERFLSELAGVCRERGVVLLSDQVYDSFSVEGSPIPSALSIFSDWGYAYSINSLSKNYGMPGVRVGWTVSSVESIRRLTGMLEMDCVAVCGIAQNFASQMLEHGNRELVNAIRERRFSMRELLRAIPGLEWDEPQGGLQYLVKVPVAEIEKFADFMMLEYGLIVATAGNFANLRGPYVRFSYAYSESVIERALGIFSKALGNYRSKVR